MNTPAPKRPRYSPPAPQEIEDLVSKILLRLPPDDPAWLLRASAVSKPWRRLLTDPDFLRRYRAFHRTPPMLGFLLNMQNSKTNWTETAQFVPTSSFRPATTDHPKWNVIDARHGRVLFNTDYDEDLVVWDPVTDQRRRIPSLHVSALCFNAAVLCAAVGCDHLDCNGGPFHIAFVGSDEQGMTFACLYSSETGQWSKRIGIEEPAFVDTRPSVLVGNTVYFTCDPSIRFKIVGYDIARQQLTVIQPPSPHRYHGGSILMTTEDGTLGFAGVQNARLYLWSRETRSNGAGAWAQRRVIEHKTMLRTRGLRTTPDVVGFADGVRVIFVRTGNTVYSYDLKSGHVRKVSSVTKRRHNFTVIPYMSFYTPDTSTPATDSGQSSSDIEESSSDSEYHATCGLPSP